MRFQIVVATFLLIFVFAFALERRYEWRQKPELLAKAQSDLARAHLEGITVTLNLLDARLDGNCPDPDGREKASNIVNKLPGVRVLDWNNHIRVPAKITYKITGSTITLSGWLPNQQVHEDLIGWVKDFRPELKISDQGIHTSPHVDLGDQATIAEGKVSKVFADVLEAIRVPPQFEIIREGPQIIVRGRVQTPELAKAIANAVANSRNVQQTKLDVIANKHTHSAPFAKGDTLAKFVASFLDSPSPGTFSIDTLNGPKLRAYATSRMESEWLALLRPVSGSARVNSSITRVPTIYHFPDYQPSSPIAPEKLASLRAAFKTQHIYFDTGSATLRPEEAIKLGPLVYLINSAGPGCTFVIAASADSGGEPGVTNDAIQRSRGDAVRMKLSQLGATEASFEVIVFDATLDTSLPPDEARRQTRRVEFLIK